MDLPTYFIDFLKNIRPTPTQQKDAQEAHRRLRSRLSEDAALDKYVIVTLLQGSYQRGTDVKPVGDKKSDVDILAITNMSKEQFSPAAALGEFEPFLETHYEGKYEPQGRSWGIEDGEVELDLVPTSAPDEIVIHELRKAKLRESDAFTKLGLEGFEESASRLKKITAAVAQGDRWREEPLEIPDRERNFWDRTHPIRQIEWTEGKNARTGSHYINIVRCVKWWRLTNAPGTRPKGYALEAIVGENCPDDITSVAQGFTITCENIVRKYAAERREGRKPEIWDVGLPENDVFKRLTVAQFAAFYDDVAKVAPIAREALESTDKARCVALWRSVFGDEFPSDEGGSNGKGGATPPAFTRPDQPARPKPERFA